MALLHLASNCFRAHYFAALVGIVELGAPDIDVEGEVLIEAPNTSKVETSSDMTNVDVEVVVNLLPMTVEVAASTVETEISGPAVESSYEKVE